MAVEGKDVDVDYGIVANIPASFHSSDLRNYFSQFIEAKAFKCFHFRHRPETKILEKDAETSSDLLVENGPNQRNKPDSAPASPRSSRLQTADGKHGTPPEASGKEQKAPAPRTFCCIVQLSDGNMNRFIRMYHKKHWIDRKGAVMSSRCFISRIRVEDKSDEADKYVTRGESKLIPPEREAFSRSHLTQLAELNPPDLMPNGNVGTPTAVFLEYIRTCRLPPRVIQKLGLTFSKTRTNRRYGNVPFVYGGDTVAGQSEEEEVALTASGQEIVGDSRSRESRRKRPSGDTAGTTDKEDGATERREDSSSDEDDDDDTCEEWERHESLHEDITSQERTKERLFEEEIELKWEKGGSGLVFYTDAAFWDAQEGDFDEKTSDDWDVDMSIYYDEHGGDKDARDSVAMRRMERMKRGLEDTSVFEKEDRIGRFEKHTKGIGRKVLQKQGWSDGQGLGKTAEGMADALDNSGQHSRDKSGFGYYGEKLQSGGRGTWKRQRVADKEVIISTIYDDPARTDPQEPLMRSRGPHHLKYRHEIEFVKGDPR
ncbi:G patch domain-containing protein 3-like [Diadema antillarum]|uniref:G patch domain-containing protein 3-like n=1 Tax=Diadema antillarum TaxID=105358 RepID=UPI003A83FB47